ncbi:zonular occludens toxin domain-containing protein [Pseudaeromonas paramecii]|uniref:Zona occludens toxin N-terminal domain-containing protein n=1 Tax=Pseudaeromonas paramecii TaxID=2138166 RepID=A0ABP8PVC8_9GAMM
MITLITGVPGGGKTLYCVAEVLLPLDAANQKLPPEQRRKIFVDGIPDLLIEHEVAPDITKWHEWAPDGCLIVVDECQRVWRPTSAAAKVTDDIAALETHRHRGIDFIVITQHPSLIHSNVRRLVGKHIHLRRTALGVYAYEWSECANPDSVRSALTKVRWSHPKSAFGKYKSASLHTKVKFRVPPALKVFIGSVIISLVLAYHFSKRIMERMGLVHDDPVVQLSNPPQARPGAPVAPQAPELPSDGFVMPRYAHDIYLVGVSGQRDDKGRFSGVVIFKSLMSGRWVFLHAEDLEVLGYRVNLPNNDLAVLVDPKGNTTQVSWEPLEYNPNPADGHDYTATGGTDTPEAAAGDTGGAETPVASQSAA